MNNKKYLVFTPYFSGLSNIIMSYEIAFSLAYISGRTLVLPPNDNWWLISESQEDKTKWNSIWEIFDRNLVEQEFDFVDLTSIEELSSKLPDMESFESYTGNIDNMGLDVYSFRNPDPSQKVINRYACFVNNTKQYINTEDFTKFTQHREVIDLSERKEKYISFSNCLFGHYWYMVYPGGPEQRNILKNKINKSLRYKQKYFDLVQQKVGNVIGQYNAVHVRRGDSTVEWAHILKSVDNPQKLLMELSKLFDPTIPLYISTDEEDKSFFDEVAKKYVICFYGDFDFNLNKAERAIVEQIICSQANHFVGSWPSTYSKRINVMRGLSNKSTTDYMGINKIIENTEIKNCGYPWLLRPNSEWHWYDSSYIQWNKE